MKARFLFGIAGLAVVTAVVAGWGPKGAEPAKGASLASLVRGLPSAPEAALLLPPLRPGDKAPDFTLPDQDGKVHHLSNLRGKTVVLSFYPKDLTLGCSTEALSLTNMQPALKARNAVVFGVSVQPVSSKNNFATRLGIGYPLLADTNRTVARDYRVLNKDRLAGRVTFIIGPDGIIQSTDQNVHTSTHGEDVVKKIDKILASSRQQQKRSVQQKGLAQQTRTLAQTAG